MKINIERLRCDLEELGCIGRDPGKPGAGVTRPSFSRADLEARAWLKKKLEEAGLTVRQDGAGNISGRLDLPSVTPAAAGASSATGPAILIGSHIDTVLNAGMFDGSVGVLAALECARRIREEGVGLTHPLEVIAFTDEEGNLVGDFLGSRAYTGRLNEAELRDGLTSFGRPIKDVLAGTDFSVETILAAHGERTDFDAYLELHIEQGAVLDTEEIPVGIVERIAGKRYYWCSFRGKSEHAGTTPLELRQDAFLGTADLGLKATQLVATRHYGSMVTIGKVLVHPGSFSVVPGLVEFSLEFRSTSRETLETLNREILALAWDIASTRGLLFASKLIDATDPVELAPRLVGLAKEECEKLGYPYMMMASGAGHDAQILAGIGDTAMIFIPSPDGISHAPAESVRWEDLEKGANLLLNVILRLAS